MENRRSINRWQINWQPQIRFDGAESFTKCLINDITLKGVRVTLYQRLPVDTFLKFSLSCTKECILDNVEAWLVWHKHNVFDDSYTYGLYFTRIHDGDKEKIYQFVRCCFPAVLNAQWWQISEKEALAQQNNIKFRSQLEGKQEGGEVMDEQRIFGLYILEAS